MTHYKKPTAWMCLLAQTLFLFLVPAARAESGTDDPAPYVPARPFLSDAGADSTRWAPETKSSRRKWGLIGAGTGLVAGVAMAIWVKSEADDRYDIYLNTADPDEARKAFDEAQRYDRATLVGWGLAQISFVAFVYFLTRESERPLVPVQGEPLVRPQKDGIQVGFRFTP